jgi:hypothetical protein
MDDVALLAAAELDPHRIDQHQPVELRMAAGRDLGREPAAERKPDQRRPAGDRVEHVAADVHEVVHRVEFRRQRRGPETRQRRRDHLAVLGEHVEKRRLRADRVDPVQQHDRPPGAAAQHFEIKVPSPQRIAHRKPPPQPSPACGGGGSKAAPV